MTEQVSLSEFERRFDDGEDVIDCCDVDHPLIERAALRDDNLRVVNVSLPAWLIDVLDDEAARRGVSRKAVINGWLVDRADREAARSRRIA